MVLFSLDQLELFFSRKMMEAMVERTPEFFLKFRKDFRFLVSYTEPKIGEDFKSTVNFVFGFHSEEHDFYCQFSPPHYHLLLEIARSGQSDERGHIVPCLYSTYFFLLHKCRKLKRNGEIILRLQLAVDYNEKLGENGFFKRPKKNKEKIPCLKLFDKVERVPESALNFLNRLCILLNGPHSSVFLTIMDILVRGNGSIRTDTIHFVLQS